MLPLPLSLQGEPFADYPSVSVPTPASPRRRGLAQPGLSAPKAHAAARRRPVPPAALLKRNPCCLAWLGGSDSPCLERRWEGGNTPREMPCWVPHAERPGLPPQAHPQLHTEELRGELRLLPDVSGGSSPKAPPRHLRPLCTGKARSHGDAPAFQTGIAPNKAAPSRALLSPPAERRLQITSQEPHRALRNAAGSSSPQPGARLPCETPPRLGSPPAPSTSSPWAETRRLCSAPSTVRPALGSREASQCPSDSISLLCTNLGDCMPGEGMK